MGLQANLCAHLCCWCNINFKNLENSGNLRTLGSLKASSQSFRNRGSVLPKVKMTGNVVRDPIIIESDGTLILNIIPPTELHLRLGVVNLCLKHSRASSLILKCGLQHSTSNRVHAMEVNSKEMNVEN